ncbi:MAG: hypothetical protein CEE40_09690 [Chloroflexi bacterium B3_Chlor]|nr:MAG: hypothetical protein CEE40_09690 [Chloroflexi bacterium B3_Chlor]
MHYIYFHDVSQTEEIGGPEVEGFLTQLAISENVAASTENQALSALFLDGSQAELIPAPPPDVVAGSSAHRV